MTDEQPEELRLANLIDNHGPALRMEYQQNYADCMK